MNADRIVFLLETFPRPTPSLFNWLQVLLSLTAGTSPRQIYSARRMEIWRWMAEETRAEVRIRFNDNHYNFLKFFLVH